MAEVNVVKQPKQERAGISRLPGFDTSLFGGSLFSMNPFALMRQLTEDMDRMFTQMPRGAVGGRSVESSHGSERERGQTAGDGRTPGLKKEDVKVHIDGDTLVVEGERKQEKEEKREGYYRSERSYGKFYRSVLLPEGAKADQAAAEFNNGVLEVSIPIPERKAKPQEVPIQEGSKKAALAG